MDKKYGVIDFHTHAFPDSLAARAVAKLSEAAGISPSYDGTVKGLLSSMDRAGIEKSVVLNIATKPSQVKDIIKWCLEIKSERIIPFASIHPGNTELDELFKKIKGEGLTGIKLHPMYQDFYADDEKMHPIYDGLQRYGLTALFHCGYDIAFPGDTRASVERIMNVKKRFPSMKLIASHTGGWKDWSSVLGQMAGCDIYIELSMTSQYMDDISILGRILEKHPPDKILFGTDSPWGDQKREVEFFKKYFSDELLREGVFCLNAERILTSGN